MEGPALSEGRWAWGQVWGQTQQGQGACRPRFSPRGDARGHSADRRREPVGAARSGVSSSALSLLLSASKISAHKWQRGKLPLVQCQQSGGGGGLSVPSTTSGDSARL